MVCALKRALGKSGRKAWGTHDPLNTAGNCPGAPKAECAKEPRAAPGRGPRPGLSVSGWRGEDGHGEGRSYTNTRCACLRWSREHLTAASWFFNSQNKEEGAPGSLPAAPQREPGHGHRTHTALGSSSNT